MALERVNWSNAEHRLRVQAGYDPAKERRRLTVWNRSTQVAGREPCRPLGSTPRV